MARYAHRTEIPPNKDIILVDRIYTRFTRDHGGHLYEREVERFENRSNVGGGGGGEGAGVAGFTNLSLFSLSLFLFYFIFFFLLGKKERFPRKIYGLVNKSPRADVSARMYMKLIIKPRR